MSIATPRLLLEEATPAAHALSWRIHTQAFAHEGAQAWLDFRIPYSVTGNIALARQKVQTIRSALPVGNEPIAVLELGAGLGFFAWHFIQAWQEWDQRNSESRPLNYLLTDFSRSTLDAVAQNSHFQSLIESGQLGIFCLDQPSAENLEPVSEPLFKVPSKLDAVIGNYYACTLPTTLLRRDQDILHEKWVKTWLNLPDFFPVLDEDTEVAWREWVLNLPVSQKLSAAAQAEFACLIADLPVEKMAIAQAWSEKLPFTLLSQLEESVFYEPLPEPEPEDRSRELLEAASIQLDEQSFPWTHGLWQRLELLQNWLKPGSLLLLSDKGYYVSSGVLPSDLAQPSCHGNTWAYPLHLDLQADWLSQKGWQTAHTPYPFDPLQTLIAIWQPQSSNTSLSWESAFQTYFIEQNINLDAARLVKAAQDYHSQEDDQMAVGFYQKALRYRPGEPRIIHELTACLIRLGAFQLAQEALQQNCLDLYSQFDFDYQKGQIAFFLGQSQVAYTHFRNSLTHQGDHASVYYSLALCALAQEQAEEAFHNLTVCLELDPEHDVAEQLLKRLSLSTF
jgi:hypothetical protein